MTCDLTSLTPFNNNGTCVSCQTAIPNCRICQQSDSTTITCKVCKIPFTGPACARNCGDGMVQLNEGNCQPFTAAFPFEGKTENICSGAKYGAIQAAVNNGDTSCLCTNDKKPKNQQRHFTGPNCDRRKVGVTCNGTLFPVCSGCNNADCAGCIPGTLGPDPASGCCNNGCKTCLNTTGNFETTNPFPPSVCKSCDPDSIRSVLKDDSCISCFDAINGCLKCAQNSGAEAQCTQCRDRLTGENCERECPAGTIQHNINFCSSTSCTETSQCNGNGTCVKKDEFLFCSCNSGFIGANCETSTATCNIENCAVCSVSNVCSVCDANYMLSENTCAPKTCEQIITNCATCDGVFPNFTCKKCSGSFTQSDCKKQCPGNYVQFTESQCQNPSCISGQACSGNGTCQVNMEGDKVCNCTQGFAGQNCENQCDSSCATCTSADHKVCTSCPPGQFLVGSACISCQDVPNCHGCAQTAPESAVTCEFCSRGFTGISCEKECPEGQVQYNSLYCQATSCDGAKPCNGYGACSVKSNNFVCTCDSGVSGANCEVLTTGKKCGGGPEIKNCFKCTNGKTCAQCFMGAALSTDALQCCAVGCHSCESATPSTCFGCDKASDAPFFDNQECKTCEQVYPNCQSCAQIGFLNKVTCSTCKATFTGEDCTQQCPAGNKQFMQSYCQPITCDDHVPCNGEGQCVRNQDDMVCQCQDGVGGINCESRPPCSVQNCKLCQLHDSNTCQECINDYKIQGNMCAALTCQESIPNCQSLCQGSTGNFTCGTCKHGYTGEQCDKQCDNGYEQYEQEHCQPTSCASGCNSNGVCQEDSTIGKKCVCNENFSGPNCENNCAAPCKTCQEDKTTCLSCYNFDVVEGSTCTNCQTKFPNCDKCAFTSPLSCNKCLPHFTGQSCEIECKLDTVPYNNVGCQPFSCTTPHPCSGQSQCTASGTGLKCTCKSDSTGPNCEIHSGSGKTCNGKYKIEKCVICTNTSPAACAICAAGTTINHNQTECCTNNCGGCEMEAPTACTKCKIDSDFPFLKNANCVGCTAAIPNCRTCTQADQFTDITCDACTASFTGVTCETDCGAGMKQFNGTFCQSVSCEFSVPCGGNGACKTTSGNSTCECKPGYNGRNCENLETCEVQNCQTCVQGDAKKCKVCAPNYQLTSYKHCELKQSCVVENCLTCVWNNPNRCQGCAQDYDLTAAGSCEIAQICKVKDCQTCVMGNENQCEICYKSLDPLTNCTDCKFGLFLSQNVCKSCGEGCGRCTSANKCISCADGSIPVKGKCSVQTAQIGAGGIAGIVIAILAVLLLVTLVVILIRRRKSTAVRAKLPDGGLLEGHNGSQVAVVD
ncbi:Cysteine-rich membrane protein 2 [Spironucleus salmonicida]|uniref:Cysteine-rich membrane protein 2 n=3 Tax=Spironucleus salmonicida TaxID=348837 RepID=A0A9P8RX93_9EUKA|nr:Cysteine-rich membrane protein 2 [Spironucleus salmonicida]